METVITLSGHVPHFLIEYGSYTLEMWGQAQHFEKDVLISYVSYRSVTERKVYVSAFNFCSIHYNTPAHYKQCELGKNWACSNGENRVKYLFHAVIFLKLVSKTSKSGDSLGTWPYSSQHFLYLLFNF